MTQLLLHPTDVLFFRDGRPIAGGLAGHGAAWPMPSVTNAAIHAALHRANPDNAHPHDHRREKGPIEGKRKFGSLLTAGPFPVRERRSESDGSKSRSWFFPRPADVQRCAGCDRLEIVLRPAGPSLQWTGGNSSLPPFLQYAVASCRPPAKEAHPAHWLDAASYERYLGSDFSQPLGPGSLLANSDIFLPEFAVGIGMNPATGTQDGERIYSAHYLRLHENWRLGLVADCEDKTGGDLIAELFSTKGIASEETQILVGGQQRVCSARRISADALPLPQGVSAFSVQPDGKCRVKWVLLSSAIWPEIPGRPSDERPINPHPGGWLPNWIRGDWDAADNRFRDHPDNGKVKLVQRTSEIKRDYSGPRHKRVSDKKGIAASLVAAIVPKPVVVTGYALGNEDVGSDARPGAKPTHLAVPAGAVYYFEADSSEEAQKLADALNWHGVVTGDPAKDYTTIKNRRSTLFGEKGFGLGVCGTWQFHGTPSQ